jgi:aldehyde dehydrogenase (NAD+)
VVQRWPAVPIAAKAMARKAIGDPRDPATLIGPLIDVHAADGMARALDEARAMLSGPIRVAGSRGSPIRTEP